MGRGKGRGKEESLYLQKYIMGNYNDENIIKKAKKRYLLKRKKGKNEQLYLFLAIIVLFTMTFLPLPHCNYLLHSHNVNKKTITTVLWQLMPPKCNHLMIRNGKIPPPLQRSLKHTSRL